MVFKDAKNVEGAKDFLRYLLSEGRLGAYLEASLGRGLPAMPALLDTPFWQDPRIHIGRPPSASWGSRSRLRTRTSTRSTAQVDEEAVWEKAVHRIVADGLTPEQAADEAIARVKEILAE